MALLPVFKCLESKYELSVSIINGAAIEIRHTDIHGVDVRGQSFVITTDELPVLIRALHDAVNGTESVKLDTRALSRA